MSLTDPSFISRLESLFLTARRVLGGSLQADRKSTRKGIQSKQLAAALGYISLNCHDRIVPYAMADKLQPIIEPSRGRGAILPFLRSLEQTDTFGSDTQFLKCIKELQARHTKKGVVLVISDFLYPDGFDEGLRLLQGMKHDTFCLQIHDPEDLKCEYKGDIQLECVETKKRTKVTVTKKEVQSYEKAIADWNEKLRKTCVKREIGYLSTSSGMEFEDAIIQIIRTGGLAG